MGTGACDGAGGGGKRHGTGRGGQGDRKKSHDPLPLHSLPPRYSGEGKVGRPKNL